MIDLMSGLLVALDTVAGLFFLRFWFSSRDRLFALFGAAFWILALHWLALALVGAVDETRHYFYAIRLLGFLVVLVAIIDKNRSA